MQKTFVKKKKEIPENVTSNKKLKFEFELKHICYNRSVLILF